MDNLLERKRLEPWLTKRQLAGHLHISTKTIERLDLPHLRVGGQNRYRVSEVESALKARAEGSATTLGVAPNATESVAEQVVTGRGTS
jgi:hypothetical protein